ncbi:hypothetical protein E2C01_097840 [Portunus trituberculatus]|uniref:Uncharacterized protein n=1 Tax=Portunus trituberculatus TaxID=210409 RepID=A0A5B7K6N5_PORTR|nr:hypothetical protein [Portunus trituberculatus]
MKGRVRWRPGDVTQRCHVSPRGAFVGIMALVSLDMALSGGAEGRRREGREKGGARRKGERDAWGKKIRD